MSKPKPDERDGPTRVKLSEFRERKQAGAIDIETDDGDVFRVPPPELWPDGLGDTEGDPVAAARLIMGSDRYDEFVAAGGSARILAAIVEEHNGASMGESSASSNS